MSKKKRRKLTAIGKENANPPFVEEAPDPYLKATILEIVENQLNANDPPETQQTLERLLAAGYKRQQAVEMIASAVVEEIWMTLHEEKESDHERFVAKLNKLE